ncbi:MAG: hypothetical protein K0V04_03110 [Deltaproteobacteria bacterium]|nr:hypothetical protein [Deltaproteobacteria bacterium]
MTATTTTTSGGDSGLGMTSDAEPPESTSGADVDSSSDSPSSSVGEVGTGLSGTTGEPFPDYGPCPCGPDQLEAVLAGVDGCFCSPACDDAMMISCPDPQTGASPGCGIVSMGTGGTPTHCILVCDARDECPLGASCLPVRNPGVNICTFP